MTARFAANSAAANFIAANLPAIQQPLATAEAFAASNIALCKYWGKREPSLNLPTNSSLSISLAELGSRTTLSVSDCDSLVFNGEPQALDSALARKLFAFIDMFRQARHLPLKVVSHNNIPTAAGLASSASGFAALVLALDKLLQLNLPSQLLSVFARIGSGSAARSVYSGFVRWDMGTRADGADSCAQQLNCSWPELRIGIVSIDTTAKAVNSTDGMNRTVDSSFLYASWATQAQHDIKIIAAAAYARDLTALGSCAEHNALSMHATMLSAWPPLVYMQPATLAALQQVWQMRAAGVEVYATIDAGPNLKLIFNAADSAIISAEFANLLIVSPFN